MNINVPKFTHIFYNFSPSHYYRQYVEIIDDWIANHNVAHSYRNLGLVDLNRFLIACMTEFFIRILFRAIWGEFNSVNSVNLHFTEL